MSTPSAPAAEVLRDPHFPGLKHFIIERTGLSYYEDKERDLAEAIVRTRGGARWLSAIQFQGELAQAQSAVLDRLAEELTIGETFFFRHGEMFDALRQHVLPEIRRRKESQHQLRIWSAGCSVGAEPYSLSILLKTELAPMFHEWQVEIIGTDINRRFLGLAREGVFEGWALRGMPEEMRQRCFTPHGKKWALQPRFKQGVTFQQHNLVHDRFPSITNHLFAFDLIICRNVMIYFSQQTVRDLAEQFHRTLVPGGWLAVGHAEPHTEIFKAFRTINAPGAILYQRPSAGEPLVTALRPLPRASLPPFLPVAPVLPPEPLTSPTPPPLLPPPPVRFEPSAGAVVEHAEDEVAIVRKLADAGDFYEACQSCRRLLDTAPLSAPLHLLYGLLREQTGEWEEALQTLRKAIYLDRQLVLAHYHAGLLERRLGEEAPALRSWRNAQALIARLHDDTPIPHGDGLTAGDLRTLITQQINRTPPR